MRRCPMCDAAWGARPGSVVEAWKRVNLQGVNLQGVNLQGTERLPTLALHARRR